MQYINFVIYERESEQNYGQTPRFRLIFKQRITGTLRLLLGDTEIILKIETLSVIPSELMGLLMMQRPLKICNILASHLVSLGQNNS